MGTCAKGTLWTLEKAVYGLRESPRLWSDERDKQLTLVRWNVGSKPYYLHRCTADSQFWRIQEVSPTDKQQKLHGIMVVYVDDFLFQTADGPIRSGLLAALKEIWKLDKEVTLSMTQGLTFLGIDMERMATCSYTRKDSSIPFWRNTVCKRAKGTNVCR